MDAAILIEEEQQFSRKAVNATINILAILLLAGAAISFLFGKEGKDFFMLCAPCFLILIGLGYVLSKSVLLTQIREDGIYVKFSPFHRRFQVYPWETINLTYIRAYDAFREFGGWGFKLGPGGTCYAVSGQVGIQLVLTNNNKILIGTNQADLFAEVLTRIGKIDFPPDSLFRP